MSLVERPRKQKELRSREELIRHAATTLRNARRSRNRERAGLPDELRCECARPGCRATFPAAAQAHRRRPECFIVVPDHLAGETVLGAADRFFVVEVATLLSASPCSDSHTSPPLAVSGESSEGATS